MQKLDLLQRWTGRIKQILAALLDYPAGLIPAITVFVRWFLTVLLLLAVWRETGKWTALTLLLTTAAIELREIYLVSLINRQIDIALNMDRITRLKLSIAMQRSQPAIEEAIRTEGGQR